MDKNVFVVVHSIRWIVIYPLFGQPGPGVQRQTALRSELVDYHFWTNLELAKLEENVKDLQRTLSAW